jgi:hypothetical protein
MLGKGYADVVIVDLAVMVKWRLPRGSQGFRAPMIASSRIFQGHQPSRMPVVAQASSGKAQVVLYDRRFN